MGFYPAFPSGEENRLNSKFAPFSGDFFLPNFGALRMVLKLGMVTTCLPRARDGHYMSA